MCIRVWYLKYQHSRLLETKVTALFKEIFLEGVMIIHENSIVFITYDVHQKIEFSDHLPPCYKILIQKNSLV